MWSVEVERQEIKSQVARHCYLFCKQKLFSLARGRGPGGCGEGGGGIEK